MAKVKLSKAQQKLVDFMQQERAIVHTSIRSRAYFSGPASRRWYPRNNLRHPSMATVSALVDKGVLFENTADDVKWYQNDFHLTDQWKDHDKAGE